MKKSTVLIVLTHLFYWFTFSGLISSYYFYNSGGGPHFEIIRINLGVALLSSVIVFYLFYFLLFPRFLYKPQLIKFTIWSLLTIASATVIGYLFVTVFVHYSYAPGVIKSFPYGNTAAIVLGRVISAAVVACIMRGFITWFTEISYKKQLERQNAETNLELLKAKINPHFLFNTLNNIDILIEKDAVTASTYLKKLSDILRFTLYESPSATIPLKSELQYIQQYIDLQKIRTSNVGFVTFDHSNDLNNLEIAPMLFIPFIENAFKYSTNKKIDNAISISIKTEGNMVRFSCINLFDHNDQPANSDGGLGIELIKNRLQLLYPEKHTLQIIKDNDRYTVNLTVTTHDD